MATDTVASTSASILPGKRKGGADAETKEKKKKFKGSNNTKSNNNNGDSISFDDDYEPFSLETIQLNISKLCKRVPTIPTEGINPDDKEAVRNWGQSMQAVIEEFSLLLGCVSPATYKWGTDRSGAADQSLALLSSELSLAQEQISSACSTRLTNVLAPVVDLVVEKIVTSKEEETGNEVKTNHHIRAKVDPDFVNLCSNILCRNAMMLRQVVLANFHKAVKVIGDFQEASKKDNQHDRHLAY